MEAVLGNNIPPTPQDLQFTRHQRNNNSNSRRKRKSGSK
jgi:hypothetical protein